MVAAAASRTVRVEGREKRRNGGGGEVGVRDGAHNDSGIERVELFSRSESWSVIIARSTDDEAYPDGPPR